MAATANPVVHNNPLRPGVGWALSLMVDGAFQDGDILIATMRRSFSEEQTHEVMRTPVPTDGLLTIVVDGERNAAWLPGLYILEIGYQRGTAAGVFFSKVQIAADTTIVDVREAIDPLLAPGGTPLRLLVSPATAPAITVTLVAGIQGIRGAMTLAGDRPPLPEDGVEGDFWIDTSASPKLQYGPKADGSWPAEGWAVQIDPADVAAVAADRDAVEAAAVVVALDRELAATAADGAQAAKTVATTASATAVTASTAAGTSRTAAEAAAAGALATKAAVDAAVATGETATALAVRTNALEAILAAKAALVSAGMSAGTQIFDITNDLVGGDIFSVRRTADGALLKFTKDVLETWIKELGAVDRFPNYFDASGKFGKLPTTAVAEATDGAGIGIFSIKNESKTAFISVAFNRDAALFSEASDTFAPGTGYTYDKVPPGRISVVSDSDTTPVTVRFWRSVKSDPNSVARAAAHLARYSGTLTQLQQTAIRNLYIALYESGWIGLCAAGSMWVGRAPNNADGLLNWAAPNAFITVALAGSGSAAPFTTFAGTEFNGNNAISTLITPPVAALPKHSLLVWSDTLSGASGNRVATGNSVLRVAPNRSATLATVYTGAGSSLPLAGGQGGLQGYRRDNADSFQYFRNGAVTSTTAKTVNEATGGSRPILIGALNGASDLTSGYIGMLEFQAQTYGVTPTDAQMVALYAALNTYRTAVGA